MFCTVLPYLLCSILAIFVRFSSIALLSHNLMTLSISSTPCFTSFAASAFRAPLLVARHRGNVNMRTLENGWPFFDTGFWGGKRKSHECWLVNSFLPRWNCKLIRCHYIFFWLHYINFCSSYVLISILTSQLMTINHWFSRVLARELDMVRANV